MPVDSTDLIALAAELSSGHSEVKQRAAISRAYYASYHRSRGWEDQLPLVGNDFAAYGSHERLIARLRHPHQACDSTVAAFSRRIGAMLEDQRKHRSFADYNVKRRLPGRLAVEQMRLAEELLRLCKVCDPRSGHVSQV